MNHEELIPHLFRTEYHKIVTVLCKRFGIAYIEIAEDIVSDTFLVATETWALKGLPENPVAWLYTVSKNKTKDYFKHHDLFTDKIAREIKTTSIISEEFEIDLSNQNINDSQLKMMFAVCHPCISIEAQIGLSLNILCGFSGEEIADAFLTNKETIYKRLSRAKQKLKTEQVEIELPPAPEINNRLDAVLTTLYLLFNEGYYSSSQDMVLRKELCLEAMRLNMLLAGNEPTNTPPVNALLSLMCFHASRFDARTTNSGEIILYEDQDTGLWNTGLIAQGEYYLNKASQGEQLSKYHLEAAIAYWHTQKDDSSVKWSSILELYDKLLLIDYSPIAALNRTYALSKANSKLEAIEEAEKLNLASNHLYHCLMGNLYTGIDTIKAVDHFERSLMLTRSTADKAVISGYIARLNNN